MAMHASSVAQSCPSLCDPVDCSRPDPSVHGIPQAIILEWVAILSQGNLPDAGIESVSPVLAGRFFTTEPSGKPYGFGKMVCACGVSEEYSYLSPDHWRRPGNRLRTLVHQEGGSQSLPPPSHAPVHPCKFTEVKA